jgi:hypothetical protein
MPDFIPCPLENIVTLSIVVRIPFAQFTVEQARHDFRRSPRPPHESGSALCSRHVRSAQRISQRDPGPCFVPEAARDIEAAKEGAAGTSAP